MFSSVQICSVLNVQKTLVFDYGYTIKLLTNFFGPYRKYLDLCSRADLSLFGLYFKTAVQIFSWMEFTIAC